jgi:hypothetical protein
MRRRTIIAVSFLDGAAVVAALFFGLVPHSSSTTPRTAVAQAAPSQTARATQLLAEEARAREAADAAAKQTKALKVHARQARQAAGERPTPSRSTHRKPTRRSARKVGSSANRPPNAGRALAHNAKPHARAIITPSDELKSAAPRALLRALLDARNRHGWNRPGQVGDVAHGPDLVVGFVKFTFFLLNQFLCVGFCVVRL